MGAISALRGFRTQFLYSLFRILSDFDKGYVFKPEGKYEDLDILDSSGNYLEIIQVKNVSHTLSFSDLFSSKDSFFKRANLLLEENTDAKIRIVSFGEVSEDLKNNFKLSKKLKKKGFTDKSIKKIISSYQEPLVLKETEIEELSLKLIKQIRPFSNQETVLDLLLFWIYKTGENQKEIYSEKVLDDLDKIGEFINGQKSFLKQFGSQIRPFSTRDIQYENYDILKKQFYYGISAKYEHILYDIDVVREEKLIEINRLFLKTNIVFIHGASGQGKSTLAYRYIHEFSEKLTSYELNISNNINDVYESIANINNLSKGLDFPVLIYIDVSPQNIYWNDLLKELSSKSNLYFLITIRQEDWNRTVLGSEFEFGDYELVFNKSEALTIYNSFSEFKIDKKFIDFEDSWLHFGSKGLLLEYVYLLTQGNSLKVRLKNQVEKLEIAEKIIELEILRYVCLADSFNSKINYRKLSEHLKINRQLSQSYIKTLEKEYLLKFSEDKSYLRGLHPLRSKLLCEVLFDENDYIDKYEYIDNSLECISEQDLRAYLLNSFENKYSIERTLKKIASIKFESSEGYMGIVNSLIWKGVRDYIFIKNKEYFDFLYNKYSSMWGLILPFDFSGISEGSMLDFFREYFPLEICDEIDGVFKKLSPKEDVFLYVIRWLELKKEISFSDIKNFDLRAFGELAFWIGHLNINVNLNFKKDDALQLINVEKTSLKDISIFILGLHYLKSYSKDIIDYRNCFIKRFRDEYNIISLKEKNKKIESIYFFNVFDYKDNSEGQLDFNQKSMDVINLLRNIYPNKEEYITEGKGYDFMDLDIENDPTKKKILKKNLPLDFLVQINVLFQSLYLYQHRPDTWEDYLENVLEKRKFYKSLIKCLLNAFQAYFKTNDYKKFIEPINEINYNLKEFKSNEYFPKCISDKWGYISDGASKSVLRENGESDIISVNVASITRYSKFKDSYKNYFTSIDSFLRQFYKNIVKVVEWRTNQNVDEINYNILFSNIKESLLKLNDFHEEFESIFLKFCNSEEISEVNRIENSLNETLFYCWYSFVNQKKSISSKIFINSRKIFYETKDNLTKRITKERNLIVKKYGVRFDIDLMQKNKQLVIMSEVDSEDYFHVLILARMLIQNTLKSKFGSPKNIIVDGNIRNVFFIPLFFGHPINSKWWEINLYNLDDEFNENQIIRFFSPFNDIDKTVYNKYQFELWNEKLILLKSYERIMGMVGELNQLQKQIKSIEKFVSTSDLENINIFEAYIINLSAYYTVKINEMKNDVNRLKGRVLDVDFFDKLKERLIDFNFKEYNEDLIFYNNTLFDNYYLVCEKLINNYMEKK